MAGKVVHVEIGAADTDRAQGFWSGVFGWEVGPPMSPEMDYRMFQTAEDEGGAIFARGRAGASPGLPRHRQHRRFDAQKSASSAAKRATRRRCRATAGSPPAGTPRETRSASGRATGRRRSDRILLRPTRPREDRARGARSATAGASRQPPSRCDPTARSIQTVNAGSARRLRRAPVDDAQRLALAARDAAGRPDPRRARSARARRRAAPRRAHRAARRRLALARSASTVSSSRRPGRRRPAGNAARARASRAAPARSPRGRR